LIAVGRLGRQFQPAVAHYLALLQPYATVEVSEVAEVSLSEGEGRVLTREGELIRRRLRPGALTVVLDRTGRQLSSEELAGLLAEHKLRGKSHFQFVVGGSLGLDAGLVAEAGLRWSLSRLTFPHQLARVLVLEQLYRAFRIERGEPYHH